MLDQRKQYIINRNQTVALIPARIGSKGVRKKNIRLLRGYPLIAYSIIAARLSDTIDRVIVSTDAKEIAMIAEEYGAEVPFLRPAELARDQDGDIGFVAHAIEWLWENEHQIPEYFAHIRPTTPLREVDIIDEAIRIMKKNNDATSLRSAHLAPESPFKWFVLNETGYFKSMCAELSNEEANNARQRFRDVYIPDGYVDVLKSEFVIRRGILHGDNMLAYRSPMCVEVDTENEFMMLEYQIEKTGSKIYDYLKENYARKG